MTIKFLKFHGIELAQNSYVENLTLESLATDPTPLGAGRLWYNTTDKLFKFSSLDDNDNVVIFSAATLDDLSTEVSTLNSRIDNLTTDDIAEGTNLYYTDARVQDYLTANTYATELYVDTAVNNLIDAAPGYLDTLNELAAALGDDPNFATTVTNQIATKFNSADFDSTWDARLASKNTDWLSEGGNNLYFTNARARGAISGTDGISYDNLTGILSLSDTGVTTGTYGSPSLVPIITVDSNGRITNLTTTSVAGVTDLDYDTTTGVIDIDTADGQNFTATVTLDPFTTTNLAEGTNLYYTDERVDDRVAALFVDGKGINKVYDDTGNLLTITIDFTEFDTDDIVEGAVNTFLANRTTDNIPEGSTNLYYTDGRVDARIAAQSGNNLDLSQKTTDELAEGTNNLYYTNERVDDRIADLIVDGKGISKTYDDAGNLLTIEIDFTEFDTDDIIEGAVNTFLASRTTDEVVEGSTNLYYTDGRVANYLVTNNYATESYVDAAVSNKDNTDEITEGTTNLYYTDERVDDRVAALFVDGTGISKVYDDTGNLLNVSIDFSEFDTDDIVEGAVNTFLANRTTDNIPEGSTNLYYTDARARNAISATGDLSYNSTTGQFSVTTYKSADFDNDFSGKDTGDLTEGTNLYYTDARVGTYLTTNNYATTSDISTAVSNLTDSAPELLDTLNELAAALGDDPNFATTITNTLATKFNSADFNSTFDTRLATKTTDDVSEGSNLYYTDARVGTYLTTNSYATESYVNNALPTDLSDFTDTTGLLDIPGATISDAALSNPQEGDLWFDSTTFITYIYYNDGTSSQWVDINGQVPVHNSTDDLSEGFTNLYYTDARVDARIGLQTGSNIDLSQKTTSDLAEGSNLYYTDARVGTYLTTNNYATTSDISTAVANLVDSAPLALDTLNELAAALGDDPNFATTVTNQIATKFNSADFNSTFDTRLATKDTGDLTEGSNLYYTDARVDARVALNVGANLDLSNQTTDDLTEGSTNLYYTDARVRAALNNGTGLNYSTATGVFALADTTVTAGSYGSGSVIPVLTIDAQGRITSASTTAVAGVSNFTYDSVNEQLTITTADGGSYSVDISSLASESLVSSTVASIIDSAPTTLDTLNELAAALGDDPNFATTITNTLATKFNSADFDSTFDTRLATKDTGDLTEGSNLYYTDARVDARISNAPIDDLNDVDTTTTAPTDGDALVWDNTNSKWVPQAPFSQSDFDTAFSGKDTGDLTEGTNLYYTDARVRAAISAGGDLSYNSTTGEFSVILPTDLSDFTDTTSLLDIPGATISDAAPSNPQEGDLWFNSTLLQTFIYYNDGTNAQWVEASGNYNPTTDEISEGSTNLYYTDGRVANYLTTNNYATTSDISTAVSNLTDSAPELLDTLNELAAALGDDPNFATTITNTLATKFNSADFDLTFDTRLVTKTTDDVSEGSNLYYTDTRVRAAISAGGDLSYNSTTGQFSVTTYKSADFDTDFSGKDTGDLTEGSNLYYTDARVQTVIDNNTAGFITGYTVTESDVTQHQAALTITESQISDLTHYNSSDFDTDFSSKSIGDLSNVDITTVVPTNGQTIVWNGTKFVVGDSFSQTDFDNAFTAKDTDDLSEGSTNLYYTDARVGTYLTTNNYATTSDISTAISNLVDAAPTTLDTLNELAAALGDDPNFATTITNTLATKFNSADFNSTFDTRLTTKDTGDLTEGSNLYYTDARVDARIGLQSGGNLDLSQKTTSDLAEGTNLYYTDARVDAEIDSYVSGGTGVTVSSGVISIDQSVGTTDSVVFDDVEVNSLTFGSTPDTVVTWNSTYGTLQTALPSFDLQLGQQTVYYAKASVAITKGEVVMFNGIQGDHPLITLADTSASGFMPEWVMGIAAQDLSTNDFGYVVAFGQLAGVSTTSYTAGDLLYLDNSTAGALTTTEPSAGDHSILMAAALNSTNNGTILIRPTHKPEVDELHGVSITSKASGDLLKWDGSNWVNDSGFYTDTEVDNAISTAINNLVDSAPLALDTLNELAAALGDDPNFATTITNQIATKFNSADFNSTFDTRLATKTTDDVSEGLTNLYYTDARVQTKLGDVSGHIIPDTDVTYDLGSSTHKFRDLYLSGNSIYLGGGQLSYNNGSLVVVDNISNDTETYATESYVDAADTTLQTNINNLFSTKTTGDLAEGSNLYYTDARVGTYLTTNSYATESYVTNAIPTDLSDFTDTTGLLDSSSSSIEISDTPPSNPSEGNMWFDSTTFITYIYYNDGTSSQWVDINGQIPINTDLSDFSDTTGLLVPTTISDAAPSNPKEGDLWFNSTLLQTFIYYNDGTSSQWVQSTGNWNPTTDEIPEGFTNLYYTDAKVQSVINTNTAGFITDYTVTQSDVTQHQTALSITESQISDLGSYLVSSDLTGYATETYVNTAVANLVDSAPLALDTLNELAAALGDDPNFATTVTNQIATKWTQDNTKISNWDTAYSWGNHASAGYLTTVDVSAESIGDLNDVDTTTTAPTDGDALVWDNTNSKWVPQAPFSQSDFDTAFSGKSTDNLSEGSTNLYYTDARVGTYLTSNGYLTSETTTTLSINGNTLTYTDETGTSTNIDLSLYLDDTNLARLTSGTVAANGIATFTRDDATTFTVDFSTLFDDTNLSRITSGTLSGTTLTFTRDDATTFDVDLSAFSTINDTDDVPEGATNLYHTDARALAATDGEIVKFANMFATVNDLPNATTYHGMFAHVHATGKGYFAHAGNWVELANQSDIPTVPTTIDAFADVDTTTIVPTNGQALVWDGTNWTPGTVATSGGAQLNVSDTLPTNSQEGDTWFNTELLETFVYYNGDWVSAMPNGNVTDDVIEGTTNLYYTESRVDERIQAASLGDLFDVDFTVAPVQKQTIIWDSASNSWVPGESFSQADFEIAYDARLSVTDVSSFTDNNGLLDSISVSTTAPTDPVTGTMWYDSFYEKTNIYIDETTGWVEVGNTSGEVIPAVYMGATGPVNAVSGEMWYNTEDGSIYVYYEDIDSAQWVQVVNPFAQLNLFDLQDITDGTVGQILTTDGAGNATFQDVPFIPSDLSEITDTTSIIPSDPVIEWDPDTQTATLATNVDATTIRTLLGAGTSSFDGDYNSLTNTPDIPSDLSVLTDTTGVIPTSILDLGITDGTAEQILITDGSGNFSFVDRTGARVMVDNVAPTGQVNLQGDIWYNTEDGSFYVYYVDADSGQWVQVVNPFAQLNLFDLQDITDGTVGQVLTTDGAGNATFQDVPFIPSDVSDITDSTGIIPSDPVIEWNPDTQTATLATNVDTAAVRTLLGAGTSSFDGDYNSLTNTPDIPSDISVLTDTTGVIPTSILDLSITDGTTGQLLTSNGDGTFQFTDRIGASVEIGETAPTGDHLAGDIWWNSSDSSFYVYYIDTDNTEQWVQVINPLPEVFPDRIIDMSDYDTSKTLNDGQVLAYNSTTSKFEPTNMVSKVEWENTATDIVVSGDGKVFVDCSSAPVTVTLPANPVMGMEIRIIDATGSSSTNNITINRNGNNIESTAEDLTIDVDRAAFGLVYYDATQGWLFTEK
jgi:hypothetical protein